MFKLVDTTTFNGGDRNIVFCHTTDESLVNLYRRSLMSEVPTWAIDVAIFNRNTSARTDEVIALKLAQLVIDQSAFISKFADQIQKNIDIRVSIDVVGPIVFTSDDVPLPIKYPTPIMTLRKNEYLKLDVIVRLGTGYDHVKWRPISTVFFNMVSVDNGHIVGWNKNNVFDLQGNLTNGLTASTLDKYQALINKYNIKNDIFIILEYKGIGMFDSNVLFDLGIKHMHDASVRPISSIFSNTYVPADFDEQMLKLLTSQKTFNTFSNAEDIAETIADDIEQVDKRASKGKRRAPKQKSTSGIVEAETSYAASSSSSSSLSTRSKRR